MPAISALLAAIAAALLAAGGANAVLAPGSVVSALGPGDVSGRRTTPPSGRSDRAATLAIIRRRRERARRRAANQEVPQLLDLLAAASSAGLSAQLSLRRAASTLRGPLGHELRAAFAVADLGVPWRDQLSRVADELDLGDLRRALLVLGRTERLGTPLAEATATLAADVRARRRASSSERARTAPVKMLFPLVFLVLPAFLLLTVVPVLLTTLQSIR